MLLVMRHGDAEPGRPDRPDADRALTDRGRRRAADRRGVVLDADPDLVLCSAATRTRQTLAALGELRAAVSVEQGLYDGSAGTVMSRLAAVADDVRSAMVIGHMPTVAELVAALVARREADQLGHVDFAPAALAVLRVRVPWADLGPATAELVRHHP
jgi:phosphohistidine phosphatase